MGLGVRLEVVVVVVGVLGLGKKDCGDMTIFESLFGSSAVVKGSAVIRVGKDWFFWIRKVKLTRSRAEVVRETARDRIFTLDCVREENNDSLWKAKNWNIDSTHSFKQNPHLALI
jgi:hypothetical protein